MKNIFLITALSLFMIPALFSQTDKPAMQDPAAEPLLDRIAKLFLPGEAYQIEFRYEVESLAENYKVEDFGSVIIKGQKYKLKTEEGDVFFDGVKMWTHNPVNQEVYVTTPDPENMDQLLTVPFILMNDYKKYFKYQLKNEVKIGNNVYYEVDLYPMNLKSSYFLLRVQLDKTTGRLYSFTLQQKNGVYYRIFITEIIPNIKINDSAFSWNKEQNPDVMVIEL